MESRGQERSDPGIDLAATRGLASVQVTTTRSAAGRSPRSTTHTAAHTPQAMVTMTKLGGMLNIADSPSPSHTDIALITVDVTIAAAGRGVSIMAVAAGVTTSANSNSVPTACTAMVTAKPEQRHEHH